jgi:hypothetical protein
MAECSPNMPLLSQFTLRRLNSFALSLMREHYAGKTMFETQSEMCLRLQPPKPGEKKCTSMEATNFVVICYSSHKKSVAPSFLVLSTLKSLDSTFYLNNDQHFL